MRETLAPIVTVHKPLVKYVNPIDLFNVTTADGTSYVGGVVAWGGGALSLFRQLGNNPGNFLWS